MSLSVTQAESLGFSSSRLRRLSDTVRGYVDEGVFPGVSVVVARHGQVVFAESHGLRDTAAAQPMTPDTIVRIYSMTKPVTSVAMMMLYEEGRFNLYDPVSRYIPAFTETGVLLDRGDYYTDMDREPTIRDLLTHTAGLAYGTGDTPLDQRYVEAGLWNMDPEPTLEEWLARLTSVPFLAYQPGEQWQYSCATDVLGCLVQRLSGRPFDVFLQERIFGPLGMVDTGFYVPTDKSDRFARLYGPQPGGGFAEVPSVLGLSYDGPHAMMSGGAGLVSTAIDYLRFALALASGGAWRGGRLLGRKTLELMTINHLLPALLPYRAAPTIFDGYGFGLGFAVLMDLAAAQTPGSVGCFGWSGAASTDFWVDPREDMVGLLMTQVMPQPYGPINRQLRTMIYQALVD
jgi:CubicO group peptidase (beta-lactamase class C family)